MARKKPPYKTKDKAIRRNFEELYSLESGPFPTLPIMRPSQPVELGSYYLDMNTNKFYIYGTSGWVSVTLT